MSAIDSVFYDLVNGFELSPGDIRTRYKVSNPRDVVYRLRQEGYSVDLLRRPSSRNRRLRKYRLNTMEKVASTYTVVSG